MAVGFPTKVNYATGDVLSATNMNDLSGTVNLLESAQFAAGKNKIINGDFGINQRAFTSTTTTATYGFDRFQMAFVDGTVTYSAQTFTAGTAPVAGYEATNFAQIVTTGQTLTTAQAQLQQRIESVRTLAGQTATFSFWAKANSGTPNINVSLSQSFGTGGSPSASVATTGTVQTITTSWARYSFTIAVPSISGKTLGTTNDGFLAANIFVSGGSASSAPTVGIQSNTFQIWGVQVEAASTASVFQTATGTKQGELAACQRYYYRTTPGVVTMSFANGFASAATNARFLLQYPVTMRVAPTALEQSGTATDYGVQSAAGNTDCSAVPVFSQASINVISITYTVSSGLTTGQGVIARTGSTANGYLGWSAEL
jgi:hypothetical protein